MGSSTLNLFPKNEKAPARISFYNSVSNPVNDVYIGRYITSENPSLFHLYGREGFCFSSSEGDVVLYDNANYGSMIQFLNVDVIGYFYSPSDSRFKKNIAHTKPGAGGEIQLTDAMAEYARNYGGMTAVEFTGKHYDMGNKLKVVEAQVELALQHPEIGEAFRAYLKEFCKTL